MPRVNAHVSPHVSRQVPKVARHSCYACGRQLLRDGEKRHCHMCYDVFCHACTTHSCVLTEYHYPSDRPQSVCGTCHSLLSTFPMLLSKIDEDAGGQLLMPQQRVWVTDAQLKEDSSEAELMRDARGRLAVISPASAVPAAQMAAALNASARSKREQLQLEHGLELYLISFRPVNPETTIAIGDAARVPLRCIVRVTREGAAVRLHCTNGTIDLTVGTLVLEMAAADEAPAVPPLQRHTSSMSSNARGGELERQPSNSASSGGGTFARLRALFGGTSSASLTSKEDTDEIAVQPAVPNDNGSNAAAPRAAAAAGPPTAAASPASTRSAALAAPSTGSNARPRQSSAGRLVATDMEIDAKAAEMIEAGLKALVASVNRHFHFRPDVAQMEALAARAAHAERAKGGTGAYE